MDTLPAPALDLLPLKKYRLHPPFGVYPPGLYIESARGCPFRCTFCTLPKTIRQRSPQLVVDDIRRMIERYGVREVHFVDPTFTYGRDRTLEIVAVPESSAAGLTGLGVIGLLMRKRRR